MNQVAKAAEVALKSCPKSSWAPQTIPDYRGQRLAFETMKRQLLDDADRARARVFVMLVQWALTGTWPKFRNAPAFFVHEILTWSASKKHFVLEAGFPETPPPWESVHAAHFLDRTAISWYSLESDSWARILASEEFEQQEVTLRMMNPLE